MKNEDDEYWRLFEETLGKLIDIRNVLNITLNRFHKKLWTKHHVQVKEASGKIAEAIAILTGVKEVRQS